MNYSLSLAKTEYCVVAAVDTKGVFFFKSFWHHPVNGLRRSRRSPSVLLGAFLVERAMMEVDMGIPGRVIEAQ